MSETSESTTSPSPHAGAAFYVYVGTYTGPNSKGIYLYRLDLHSGALSPLGVAGETENPSFLAISPGGKYLCAVNEIDHFAGQNSGAITSFAISPDTGRLTRINQQPSGGSGPAYLTIDASGRNVLAANYANGSVAVLPLGKDGQLGVASCTIQHHGSSANPKRQAGPHAHSINLDPGQRFALAADLGIDKVIAYRFHADTGQLDASSCKATEFPPGTGPRHTAFHPSGRFVYINGEMGNTISAFGFDRQSGSLSLLQTLSTLPKDFSGENTSAEVLVHPSGKYLYVSNRGHNSIALYGTDEQSRRLSLVTHVSTQGANPRGMGIDPTGSYLIAANQSSDNLVVFRINAQSGVPEATGAKASVASPVCVKFLRAS